MVIMTYFIVLYCGEEKLKKKIYFSKCISTIHTFLKFYFLLMQNINSF